MECLDQAKTFGRVNHEYLWATLSKYSVPGHFIDWLKAWYCEAESFPLINGWQGNTLWVEAGVRQGFPLNPLLYHMFMP